MGDCCSLMNFTEIVGFILIGATAASASVREACDVLTVLMIATLGSLATREIWEVIVER